MQYGQTEHLGVGVGDAHMVEWASKRNRNHLCHLRVNSCKHSLRLQVRFGPGKPCIDTLNCLRVSLSDLAATVMNCDRPVRASSLATVATGIRSKCWSFVAEFLCPSASGRGSNRNTATAQASLHASQVTDQPIQQILGASQSKPSS